MTDQEINIKIASLCGWTLADEQEIRSRAGNSAWLLQKGPWWRNAAEQTVATVDQLPDYADDLNVIVGACRGQSEESKALIAAALTTIVMGWGGSDGQPNLSEREDVENYRDFFDIMAATPLQWCEAFLRVHNQWEEA